MRMVTLLLLFSSILLVDASAVPGAAKKGKSGVPLVGQLWGVNKLSVLLDGKPAKLQLDLEVPICTANASGAAHALTLNTTDGTNPLRAATVRRVPFAPSAAATAGRAALHPTSRSSLQAVFAVRRQIPQIFSYCLSGAASAPAPIFFGAPAVGFMPNGRPISPLLRYTPLSSAAASSWRISVNGIGFNGSRLGGVPPSMWRVSSRQRYSTLATPVYAAVKSAFSRMTLPRVRPVAPFELCFAASSLSSTRLGPAVPQLDLHLAGNVTWSLFGASTIAFVDDNAACLALRRGRSQSRSVLGTFQQLDHLIEFDWPRRRLGFTGLLLGVMTTCGNFNFTAF